MIKFEKLIVFLKSRRDFNHERKYFCCRGTTGFTIGKKTNKTALNIGVNFNQSCWLNLFSKHHCSRLLSVSPFTFVEFAKLDELI